MFRVIIPAVAVVVLFWLGCLISYDSLRRERIALAKQETERAAIAIEEQVSRLFDYADSYLRAVRAYYQEHGADAAFRRYIKTIEAPRAQAFTGIVTVVDRNGITLFQSAMPDSALASFGSMADLDHFRFFKGHGGDPLFVGGTRFGRMTGRYQFRVARPLLKGGQFDGEVILTLLPEHLTSFFVDLNLGPNSLVTIATLDRFLIARQPMPDARDFERPIAFTRPLFDAATPPSGAFSAKSPVDGVYRHLSYKRLQDYPVLVLVGSALVDLDAALAPMRVNLALLALVFALATSLVSLLVIRLYGERHKLVLAERRALDANLQLERLSHCDGLTGLANRRRFDAVLETEWRRALRSSKPLGLIMADVDHFKEFNDHYGHQCGDNCLQTIAAILEDQAKRVGDVVARYGGEEFALILPMTSQAEAVTLAERIRAAVTAAAIPHAGHATGHVTLSLGVASKIPERPLNGDSLIGAADRALYRAKANGRDRTIAAENEPTSNP
jgi:diguanylate cyclase (GGDEF)-like protein